MAGTIVVDRIESDSSYTSTINVASKVNFTGGFQVGGQNATFGGRRNKLINGDFKIDQKANYTEVNPANGGYNQDMWYSVVSVSGKSKQQVVQGGGPTGFNTYLAYTSLSSYTPASGEEFGIVQRIEGYNTVDLCYGTPQAKTTTVSFWVYASQTGTYPVGLYTRRTTTCNGTYTVNQANTWEYKTVTFPGDTAYALQYTTNSFSMEVRFGMGGGVDRQTSTLNQWQLGNYSQVTGTVMPIKTSGAYVYLTGVQFEIGATATDFEQRTFADELALCQRYRCSTFPIGTAWGQNAGPSGMVMAASLVTPYGTILPWQFPVAMRTAPTITTYNPGAANANARDYAVGTDRTYSGMPWGTPSTRAHFGNGDTTSAAAAGQAVCIHYSASAEL